MFHLLTETSVFLSLPNGSLCQVIGDPIVIIKPPSNIPILYKELKNAPEGSQRRGRGTKRRCLTGYAEGRPSKRTKRNHDASGQISTKTGDNHMEMLVSCSAASPKQADMWTTELPLLMWHSFALGCSIRVRRLCRIQPKSSSGYRPNVGICECSS